jgi:hypothetical protein
VAPIEEAPNFGATVTNEIVYVHPSRITWLDSQGDWDVLLIGHDPADDYTCNDGVYVGGIPARQHHTVSMEGFPDEFSQRDQFVLTTIGSPPLYLYLRSDFPPAGASDEEWCTFLTEGWIASGHWSAVLNKDNELSWLDNTPGMNAYGGTEAGVLWGTDGTKYKYEWKWKRHWDRNTGVDRLVNSVDRVVRIGQ